MVQLIVGFHSPIQPFGTNILYNIAGSYLPAGTHFYYFLSILQKETLEFGCIERAVERITFRHINFCLASLS